MSRPLQMRARALPTKTQATHLHSCRTRPDSRAERAIPDAFDSINLCAMAFKHWSVQLTPLATSWRSRASRPSAAEKRTILEFDLEVRKSEMRTLCGQARERKSSVLRLKRGNSPELRAISAVAAMMACGA
jgi:hypothetical protein